MDIVPLQETEGSCHNIRYNQRRTRIFGSANGCGGYARVVSTPKTLCLLKKYRDTPEECWTCRYYYSADKRCENSVTIGHAEERCVVCVTVSIQFTHEHCTRVECSPLSIYYDLVAAIEATRKYPTG